MIGTVADGIVERKKINECGMRDKNVEEVGRRAKNKMLSCSRSKERGGRS